MLQLSEIFDCAGSLRLFDSSDFSALQHDIHKFLVDTLTDGTQCAMSSVTACLGALFRLYTESQAVSTSQSGKVDDSGTERCCKPACSGQLGQDTCASN